jgi:hypothetical protein
VCFFAFGETIFIFIIGYFVRIPSSNTFLVDPAAKIVGMTEVASFQIALVLQLNGVRSVALGNLRIIVQVICAEE